MENAGRRRTLIDSKRDLRAIRRQVPRKIRIGEDTPHAHHRHLPHGGFLLFSSPERTIEFLSRKDDDVPVLYPFLGGVTSGFRALLRADYGRSGVTISLGSPLILSLLYFTDKYIARLKSRKMLVEQSERERGREGENEGGNGNSGQRFRSCSY